VGTKSKASAGRGATGSKPIIGGDEGKGAKAKAPIEPAIEPAAVEGPTAEPKRRSTVRPKSVRPTEPAVVAPAAQGAAPAVSPPPLAAHVAADGAASARVRRGARPVAVEAATKAVKPGVRTPPMSIEQVRIVIEGVSPQIDAGRYDVKAVVGDRIEVGADIWKDGHELLKAAVLWRKLSLDELEPRGAPGKPDLGRTDWAASAFFLSSLRHEPNASVQATTVNTWGPTSSTVKLAVQRSFDS
jgi:hypothetical protein